MALQRLAYAPIGLPPRPLDQRSSSDNAACMQKWKPFRTEPNRGFSALRIGQSLSTCLLDKISHLSLSLSLSVFLFLLLLRLLLLLLRLLLLRLLLFAVVVAVGVAAAVATAGYASK